MRLRSRQSEYTIVAHQRWPTPPQHLQYTSNFSWPCPSGSPSFWVPQHLRLSWTSPVCFFSFFLFLQRVVFFFGLVPWEGVLCFFFLCGRPSHMCGLSLDVYQLSYHAGEDVLRTVPMVSNLTHLPLPTAFSPSPMLHLFGCVSTTTGNYMCAHGMLCVLAEMHQHRPLSTVPSTSHWICASKTSGCFPIRFTLCFCGDKGIGCSGFRPGKNQLHGQLHPTTLRVKECVHNMLPTSLALLLNEFNQGFPL
jgi:hypothetical protein